MTRYQLEIFEYSHYAQKSFTYVAEALIPLLRLGTFSWIVTCDSHKKILNSQPWSRPTRQRPAAHQWAAAHRLRTAAIATSIVHSKLDYCNSLFHSINSSQITRLQTIQNALARAVTKTSKHHHITPVLKSLHWLKIPQRIHYKIASLTYNTLQTSQPSYIRQLLTIQPPGSTRSSSYLSLSRPPVS